MIQRKGTFGAFMDSTLQWAWDKQKIGDALKVALLRVPNLVVSDSQAIDNRAWQLLLQDEAFRRVASQTTSVGPNLQIGSRGISYQDVLIDWLDVRREKTTTTYLSGLSDEDNHRLRKEHNDGTLTLSRFREIAPDYYNHVAALSSRTVEPFTFVLGPDSFRATVLKTLDKFVQGFDGHPLLELARILRERWDKNLPYQNPSRNDLREDARELARQGLMTGEQLKWVEEGILNLAYQSNFSRMTEAKMMVGPESKEWIASGSVVKAEVIAKISAQVLTNAYATGLTWEGLELIRSNNEFIESTVRLRNACESDYKEALDSYHKKLRDAYDYVADKGLAPRPDRWRDTTIEIVKYGSIAAGAGAGALLGLWASGVTGVVAGAVSGAVVGEYVEKRVGTLVTGFLTKSGLFHPDPEFRQLLTEMASTE